MTLTNFPFDSILDLAPWVGQRQASFRFELFNAVSGLEKGEITPLRGASLTHDTTRTIKRQLNLELGTDDMQVVDPISDRVRLFMTFPSGVEYPLGTYMFTDDSRQVWTVGQLGSMAMSDEMFLVDQEITAGITGIGSNIMEVVQQVLAGLPIEYVIEHSDFQSRDSWGVGTNRGQILEALSVAGDYFSPWFGNDSQMHMVRTFDPATQIADFDYDAGNQVIREPILLTTDLLMAPNRFIIISNSSDQPETQVVGSFDVPQNAPHSIARRGFVIAEVQDLQISDATQAQAVAEGVAQRMTVFERVGLTTPPDPRHDSYNIIHWQGAHWLELAWSMSLVEGGTMSHLLRKAYTDD